MRLGSVDKRLFTILMIVFVQMAGMSMVLPVLPLYARREFGMSPQAITLLVSAFFIAQFAAGPYIGRLSDRYGRVPVLIVSQIGTAISFVMLALAGSPIELFASRILDGITGGNIIAAQAYVTDITPRDKRAQSLGLIFAAFGLGFIVGPAIGGLLSAVYGESTPFWVAAIAATLTILLTWRTLNEALTPEQREANRRMKKSGLAPREIIRNQPLVIILIIAFVGQFSLGLVQSTFALYGEAVLFIGYSERATKIGIGLLLATVGLAQLLTQVALLPRAIKWLDEEIIVVLGLAVRSIGMFIWAIALTPWLGAAGSMFFATGFGLAMPTLQSLSTNTVPDEVRGGVLGIYQSANSLSIIVGTSMGGVLFAITPTTPYWIGGVLSVITVLPALVLARYIRTHKISAEAALTKA